MFIKFTDIGDLYKAAYSSDSISVGAEVASIAIGDFNEGSLVPLTSGSASVTAIGASVGINELSGNNMVAIYPNPANNMLTVTSTAELQKVELLSVTGQVIISEFTSGNQHQLDVSSVSNGVYIVDVFGQNHVIQRKKIVIQH